MITLEEYTQRKKNHDDKITKMHEKECDEKSEPIVNAIENLIEHSVEEIYIVNYNSINNDIKYAVCHKLRLKYPYLEFDTYVVEGKIIFYWDVYKPNTSNEIGITFVPESVNKAYEQQKSTNNMLVWTGLVLLIIIVLSVSIAICSNAGC